MAHTSEMLSKVIDEVIASIAIFPYHGMHCSSPTLKFKTNKREINESNTRGSGRPMPHDERCLQPVRFGRSAKAD